MIVKMQPHEEHKHQIWLVYFENKGASANIAWLADRRNIAYLYDVFSKNRGQGEASKLLQEIDEWCVENEVSLVVRAEVYDVGTDGIPTNEELRNWYEKNGATFIEYDRVTKCPMLLMGDRSGWIRT